MSLRKPPALHSGDRLAIVAPASPFDREAFDRGLAELRSLGFDVTHDDTIFARRGYVAGEPAARAASVTRAWSDPTVAGIVCARGGYGSVQCLPHLDFAAMGATPKVFVGYSDLTSLLTCFTQSSGIVVFHGPTVVGRFSEGSAAYDSRTFLSAIMATVPLGEVYAPSLECVGGGDASGPLTGGTLTQLVASLGTPFAFDPPAGSVLFLDEVGERPYRLDRMLTQARLAGLFSRVSAIIVGELPRCDEPDGVVRGRAVVADCLSTFPGPVVIGFPSGHTSGPACTLPLGVTVRVVAKGAPRVVVEEAAVE